MSTRHQRARALDARPVTVCAECLKASCWQGTFPCGGAVGGTTTRTIGELDALGLEAPVYYSGERMPRARRPRPVLAPYVHGTPPVTARQARVLRFIACSTGERGYPPTMREIANELGLTGTNGASCHCAVLERKGLVTIAPRTARGLALTDAGRAYLESCPEPATESGVV